jgi:hypothetical protein
MFGLFLALTAAWTAVLVLRRECAHRIHLLMGALVLFKTLTLMAQVTGEGRGHSRETP